MQGTLRFDIPRSKAEYPVLIALGVVLFALWSIHYGIFGWQGGAVFLLIVLPVFAVLYIKFRGEYFVEANRNGIGWRKDMISKYIYIPWNYLQRVDYLEFEINFMIKETAQVVCFPLSGLSETQTDELKQYISDVVKAKMEAGEL